MIRARLVSRRLRRLRLPLPAAILLVGLSGGLAWASESEDLGIESTVTTVAPQGASGCRHSPVGGTGPGC